MTSVGAGAEDLTAAEGAAAAGATAVSVAPWVPPALALIGGVLAFLGFAGFGIWPLAFLSYVPLLVAIDLSRAHGSRRAFLLSWLFGSVGIGGGYYWIVRMLENFSGFGFAANVGIACLLFVALGGMFAFFGWLFFWATEHRWNPTLAVVTAWCAVEFLYPNLFPYYYGASLHAVPVLMQGAELGGPLLVSAVCLTVNGAVYELLRAWMCRAPVPRGPLLVGLLVPALGVVYGGVRMAQVDHAIAEAETFNVGLVQANMGLFEKRLDAAEGHRRHLEQTRKLEAETDLDLVVWPESALPYRVRMPTASLPGVLGQRDVGVVESPVLFGGLAVRGEGEAQRIYNTAFLLDEAGEVQGTYDKTYLLAFGEYLPFGEMFPVLYDWSPNTGHFTPGSHVEPLQIGDLRVAALICYEDILPGFVREAVAEGDPHVLVNMANDAWFGDTHEPWIHLALAKFRTIEHRRSMVRATNSGVSAILDPAGRVVAHTDVFKRQELHAEIPLMAGISTPYALFGDWPAYLAVPAILWFVYRRRRS